MYKVAKIKALSKITDKEDSVIHLDGLLSMLYKNGQILNNWIIEEYQDYLEVRVTTTDDDSLNSKYFNKYILKELENFTLDITILSNDAVSTDCCYFLEHSYYILAVNPDDASSPIICGDCGKEIPLIRIPYLFNEEEHYYILNFQQIYKSVDNLWMESLSDRFSKRQIINPNSQLNKLGLAIVNELEKKVSKPVYLLVANPIGGYFEFEKNNKNLECCPKCGGEFKYVNNDYADKVCDKCRLAFITHEK